MWLPDNSHHASNPYMSASGSYNKMSKTVGIYLKATELENCG